MSLPDTYALVTNLVLEAEVYCKTRVSKLGSLSKEAGLHHPKEKDRREPVEWRLTNREQ